MIAFARRTRARMDRQGRPAAPRRVASQTELTWQAGFLALLPDIRRHLSFAFRRLAAERREEALQEALANALAAYRRLHQLGKAELAYASPLAQYAARQVYEGRQIACPLSATDVLSSYAQRKRGFKVAALQQADELGGICSELLVEDRSCTPADLAASRIDFALWQRRLPRRKRRIAAMLAAGATTAETARRFQLTAGRISQLRRELAENWREFQGEGKSATSGALARARVDRLRGAPPDFIGSRPALSA